MNSKDADDEEWRLPAAYPDPAVEVLDPRFERHRLLAASVERLWTGGRWTEGPVWFGDGRYLLFSDIPNERILRWSEETGETSVFRAPSGSRERQYPRPAGPPDHLRAGGTPADADGDRRRRHRPHGLLRRQAPEQSERRRRPSGRPHLVHRSRLRHPLELRRMAGDRRAPHPGLPPRSAVGGKRPSSPTSSPARTASASHPTTSVSTSSTRAAPTIPRITATSWSSPWPTRPRLGNGRAFCDMSPGRSDGIRCDVDGNLWAASGFGGRAPTGCTSLPPTAPASAASTCRSRARTSASAAGNGTACS